MKSIVEKLEKEMQCNCDLDNWEPTKSTGHSWVCRIHKQALQIVAEGIKMYECEWKYEEDECYYNTSCGDTWYFPEGNIKENGILYCPFCGKRVKCDEIV